MPRSMTANIWRVVGESVKRTKSPCLIAKGPAAVMRLAITSVTIDSMWKVKMTRATPADSVMPIMLRNAAKLSVMSVVTITDVSVVLPIATQPSPPHRVCMYRMADVAEITAVVTYESMVRQAAMLATDLVVVFSNRLYVPPLTGKAVTTSS